jgi:hypothetical protein
VKSDGNQLSQLPRASARPLQGIAFADDSERWRNMSADERAVRLVQLLKAGRKLLAELDDRSARQAFRDREEQLWRLRWTELFSRPQK